MDQRFLEYYNRELRHVRETAGEFAREFPKIAGRLGIESLEVADPYVERLLEGFAFMAARVQLKIESQFPKFTQHLLDIVYPHFQAPMPSMAVTQIFPDLNEGALSEGYLLPKGTAMRSLLGKGDKTSCEYNTGNDLILWPLEITEAKYFASDSELSAASWSDTFGAKAGIRLSLHTTAGLAFNQLAMEKIKFYLPGEDELPMRIYEQIFANGLGFLIRPKGDKKAKPFFLGADKIRQVGFDDDQALLPFPQRSFQGYRLLQEYFNFPRRFMFFELAGLNEVLQQINSTEIEIVILFDRNNSALVNIVTVENFLLNCVPVINLFEKRADRLQLDTGKSEYHVLPDRTRPMDFEVYSISEVVGYSSGSTVEQELVPFYGQYDHISNNAEAAFYTYYRDPRLLSSRQKLAGPRSSYMGSEVFLSIVDAANAPFRSDLKQLGLKLLCTNRDLPLHMSLGKGRTDFTLDIGAPVETIRCVAGPTKPLPSTPPSETSWRLISHLSLNYLSLLDNPDGKGAAAIREMLRLYGDQRVATIAKQIEAVKSVKSEPVIRQLPFAGKITFGRGLKITLECEETAFEGLGVYLFGAVMERFFSKYVSINTFVETVLLSTERGEIKTWPARTGQTQIL